MKYEYWVASLPLISPGKRRQLCELAGGARQLFSMSEKQVRLLTFLTDKEKEYILSGRKTFDPDREWEAFLKKDIQFLVWNSEAYPERLKQIDSAPYAIFFKGTLPVEKQKCVSIVGARSCSEYGRSVAELLGRTLAGHGVQIISGMAYGVDSASHAGALRAGGKTFAVLGNGCDVCYPRSSNSIYNNILSGNGGVISELIPGTQPKPYFFPMRNRIISALCDILVVVEARERSGSLITADFALEQGKDIYAVPGRYLDELSVGCNRLIEQGAGIFVDIDSFLKNIGIVSGKSNNDKQLNKLPLEKEELVVYSVLCLSPKSIDQILEETEMDLLTVLSILDRLKKKQMILETFQNYFCKKL